MERITRVIDLTVRVQKAHPSLPDAHPVVLLLFDDREIVLAEEQAITLATTLLQATTGRERK